MRVATHQVDIYLHVHRVEGLDDVGAAQASLVHVPTVQRVQRAHDASGHRLGVLLLQGPGPHRCVCALD